MQQDPNFQPQAHQNLNQYHQNNQSGIQQYPNGQYQSPSLYNMYQQNPAGFRSAQADLAFNAQPLYSYMSQNNQQPHLALGNDQMQAINAQNTAHNIESKIVTGFCCYTCLVYFELIVSLVSLIFTIVVELNLHQGGLIVINVASTIVMFAGCVSALLAKGSFDKAKQLAAFVLYILATILSLTSIVFVLINLESDQDNYESCGDASDMDNDSYYYCMDQYASITAQIIVTIIAIPVQLLIGCVLIFSAYSLFQLMSERHNLLTEAKIKNNAPGAAVI